MTLQSFTLNVDPNSDGVVRSRKDINLSAPNPDLDVVWSTIGPYTDQAQSSAFSVDIRALAQGVGAATGTLSIVSISGDSAATLGLSFSGDNLESSNGTIGSGVFRVRMTYGGVDYDSNSFTYSVVAAPAATDIQSPTFPIPRSLSYDSLTGEVTVTFLPGCDPVIPGSTSAGLKQLDVYRSADGGAFSTVGSVLTPVGLSIEFEGASVGPSSIAGSVVRQSNGVDYSITAEHPGGFDTTGNDGYGAYEEITGDFDAFCAIPQYTAPLGSKTQAMLVALNSLVTNETFVCLGRLSNAASSPNPRYSEMKARDGFGGSLIFLGNPDTQLVGEHYFWLNRTGNLFSGYRWSLTEADWVPLYQITLNNAASTMFVGAQLSSGLAGVSATVLFKNLTINNIGPIAYIDSTVSEGVTYDYYGRLQDGAV